MSPEDRTGTGWGLDGAGPFLPTTASWNCSPLHRFWFRLYWFPLKVLYATCHCSLRSVPDIPFYFFFNTLLLLLTLMNLYWFLVSQPLTAPRPAILSAGSPVLVPIPGQWFRCRPFSCTSREGHVRQRKQHMQTASGRSM